MWWVGKKNFFLSVPVHKVTKAGSSISLWIYLKGQVELKSLNLKGSADRTLHWGEVRSPTKPFKCEGCVQASMHEYRVIHWESPGSRRRRTSSETTNRGCRCHLNRHRTISCCHFSVACRVPPNSQIQKLGSLKFARNFHHFYCTSSS